MIPSFLSLHAVSKRGGAKKIGFLKYKLKLLFAKELPKHDV
jgi:hypothetical protein